MTTSDAEQDPSREQQRVDLEERRAQVQEYSGANATKSGMFHRFVIEAADVDPEFAIDSAERSAPFISALVQAKMFAELGVKLERIDLLERARHKVTDEISGRQARDHAVGVIAKIAANSDCAFALETADLIDSESQRLGALIDVGTTAQNMNLLRELHEKIVSSPPRTDRWTISFMLRDIAVGAAEHDLALAEAVARDIKWEEGDDHRKHQLDEVLENERRRQSGRDYKTPELVELPGELLSRVSKQTIEQYAEVMVRIGEETRDSKCLMSATEFVWQLENEELRDELLLRITKHIGVDGLRKALETER